MCDIVFLSNCQVWTHLQLRKKSCVCVCDLMEINKMVWILKSSFWEATYCLEYSQMLHYKMNYYNRHHLCFCENALTFQRNACQGSRTLKIAPWHKDESIYIHLPLFCDWLLTRSLCHVSHTCEIVLFLYNALLKQGNPRVEQTGSFLNIKICAIFHIWHICWASVI